jgi:hypothetical protein
MFCIDCPAFGREVVIWNDQVVGCSGTAHRTAAEFRCACGSVAVCVADRARTRGRLVYHARDTAGAAPL